jgi:hypothetical protein
MADNTGFEFLQNLAAEEAELPRITRAGGGNGRQRLVQDNPFVKWLQEGYNSQEPNNSVGKQVKVPARHARKTEYLIRQAAEDLNIGVRVVFMVDGEVLKGGRTALKDINANKTVAILFQGQRKRKFAPRRRRNTTPLDDAPQE